MPPYDLFISYRRLDAQRVRPLGACPRIAIFSQIEAF
jgi:hypothetical protein